MDDRTHRFEDLVLPHLDAAYNLARWLMRDPRDAEDVVQDACLRAFRFFDGLRNADARPWLLSIVRHTCFDWMQQQRHRAGEVELDDSHDVAMTDGDAVPVTPEGLLLQSRERERVNQALHELPPVFREVIVLRELEELSYEDIARIVGVPTGTVMSRLSRGRARLREALGPQEPPAPYPDGEHGPARKETR